MTAVDTAAHRRYHDPLDHRRERRSINLLNRMKVYLNWSGPRSHAVAIAVRDWLPLVIPGASGIVSPAGSDADPGAEGDGGVEGCDCAVICVTPDNITSPRVYFQAGALWRTLTAGRMACLLAGVRPAELDRSNPLLRFECIAFESEDVLRLVRGIASAGTLAAPHLEAQFEMWWPQLKDRVGAAIADPAVTSASSIEKTRLEVMVEELLELTRQQARRMPPGRRWLEPQSGSAKNADRRATHVNEAPSSHAGTPLLDEDGLPVATPTSQPAGAPRTVDSTWMDDWLNEADRNITPPAVRDEP